MNYLEDVNQVDVWFLASACLRSHSQTLDEAVYYLNLHLPPLYASTPDIECPGLL